MEAFPPLGAPIPRHNGPVATRAPILQPRSSTVQSPMAVAGPAMMQGAPIILPMANQNQPRPNQPLARPPKKQPMRSFELVLHRMPFLGLSKEVCQLDNRSTTQRFLTDIRKFMD